VKADLAPSTPFGQSVAQFEAEIAQLAGRPCGEVRNRFLNNPLCALPKSDFESSTTE
jgi:hypothetical protein